MAKVNTELLKMYVKQSGFTYMELAEDAEVSRNTIHNVIVGRTNPSLFVSTRLAVSLKLSEKDIISIFYPTITLNE